MSNEIYMICASGHGERDWEGDYNYLPNPLSKYASKSNLWEFKEIPSSCHGYGCAGYVIKTTMEALEIMGWAEDYNTYKTTQEVWEEGYKRY